jgi:hypothetical protein
VQHSTTSVDQGTVALYLHPAYPRTVLIGRRAYVRHCQLVCILPCLLLNCCTWRMDRKLDQDSSAICTPDRRSRSHRHADAGCTPTTVALRCSATTHAGDCHPALGTIHSARMHSCTDSDVKSPTCKTCHHTRPLVPPSAPLCHLGVLTTLASWSERSTPWAASCSGCCWTATCAWAGHTHQKEQRMVGCTGPEYAHQCMPPRSTTTAVHSWGQPSTANVGEVQVLLCPSCIQLHKHQKPV